MARLMSISGLSLNLKERESPLDSDPDSEDEYGEFGAYDDVVDSDDDDICSICCRSNDNFFNHKESDDDDDDMIEGHSSPLIEVDGFVLKISDPQFYASFLTFQYFCRLLCGLEERAHSRCRFLANTLSTEKEVVMCLNHVLSWVIVGATFLMWLLITGLATTKVLVLLASPLLAATFIFGDTCKNLFQGLIFIYVVHPFHVGDLCLVDDKLMEVKTIGVWSTTFSMVRTVGKRQDVIYPNSELATKNVINHRTEFDWNDYIEFTLTSPQDETTKNLKQQIETYLDTEKEKFTPAFHSVAMLEIGDNAKIA